MKNIWKKHKIKIVAFAYVVAAGFLLYFAVFSIKKEIEDKSDKIQSQILDREIESSRVSAISKMEEDHKYSQENSKALEVLLSREEGVDFIKKMENIAQETGNAISFKVEEAGDKKDVKKPAPAKKDNAEKTIQESLSYDSYISIQIDLKGDYGGLISFLEKLENTRNYINIISLESKTEKEATENSANVKNNQEFGVFSPTPVTSSAESTAEKKEKNILHSVVNVVVYTKK
ncbi:MAG: hypothetical protein WCV59_04590 [Parcubacteria group bacterium]|jgi:hypothetical protein